MVDRRLPVGARRISIVAALLAKDPARDRRGTELGDLHDATRPIRPDAEPADAALVTVAATNANATANERTTR